MRVLLLQLCRMGDVIQTLPLVDALIARGDEVHLLLHESMRPLPLTRPGLELHFVSLPTSPSEPPPNGTVTQCLKRLEAIGFDTSVNLSFDEPSALIATYLETPVRLGLSVGRDRRTRALDPWTVYLLCLPERRRQGPFNLVQVYGHLTGVRIGPEQHQHIVPSDSRPPEPLEELRDSDQPAPRIGLVPGASDTRKRWPSIRFAELAERLRSLGHSVCLLGSPDERPLGDAIVHALGDGAGPGVVYDWIGKTDLEQLCEILRTLDLVITNDTGTMHLAAALGVKTLTVTLGPAHVFESAPFASGHLTVESEMACHPCEFASYCPDPECGPAIPSDAVAELALDALEGRSPSLPPADGYRGFVSEFDDQGRLVQKPLARYPLSTSETVRAAYENLWERALHAPQPVRSAEEIAASLVSHWDVTDLGSLNVDLARMQRHLEDLVATMQQGTDSLLELTVTGEEPAGRLATLTKQLEEKVDLAGRIEPNLAPLTSASLMQLSMAGGRNPGRALMDMLSVLSGGLDRGRLFLDLVQRLRRAFASTGDSRPIHSRADGSSQSVGKRI